MASITGKIMSINCARTGTAIGLDNDPNKGPKNNTFLLKLEHSNYNALFSLALAAAANRWPLSIRIEGNDAIDSAKEADVRNMGVAWKEGAFNDD